MDPRKYFWGQAVPKKLKTRGFKGTACPLTKPQMEQKQEFKKTARTLSFSMIKPLIDNAYEDVCYDLVYNLEPCLIASIKQGGIPTETDVIKILLRNSELYDALYDYNEGLRKQREFNNMLIMKNIIEYINKMNEAGRYIAQAEQLKRQYGL